MSRKPYNNFAVLLTKILFVWQTIRTDQVSAGLNSPNAKKFGDAHENTSRNDIKAKAMDLHNNSVGYHLGNQAIINGWNEEELLNQVINAADNGTLKIIK